MNKQNLPQSLQVYQQGITDAMRIYHDLLAAQFDLMQQLAPAAKYEHWLVQWQALLRQL